MIAFSIRKMVGCLLMPAGILWLMLLVSVVLAWRNHRRMGGLLLALTLVYTLVGNVMLGHRLMFGLERTFRPVDLSLMEPFDAVFVLGGGVSMDGRAEPKLSNSGDRAFVAARLWYKRKTRYLVASGASPYRKPGQDRDSAALSKALWMDIGIPPEAILVVDRPCWVTRDEIRAYVDLRNRMGWKRVALLSSANHLPRVMSLARRYGLDATPIPSDDQGGSELFQVQNLIPQGKGFHMVQDACWERLGRLID